MKYARITISKLARSFEPAVDPELPAREVIASEEFTSFRTPTDAGNVNPKIVGFIYSLRRSIDAYDDDKRPAFMTDVVADAEDEKPYTFTVPERDPNAFERVKGAGEFYQRSKIQSDGASPRRQAITR